MTRRSSPSIVVALAVTSFLAGCGGGTDGGASTVPSVRTSVSLAQSVAASAASQAIFDNFGGRVPLSWVDSLIVTVTRVDVLPDSLLAACRPPVGDSIHGFHPGYPGGGRGPGPMAMSGPALPSACRAWMGGGRSFGPNAGHPVPDSIIPFPRPDAPRTHDDSLLPPPFGWGSFPWQWYSLAVVGSGRVDLLHLPADTASGLMLASDSVPAGAYGAARLIISGGTIWFNTAVTTRDSVTLLPNTGYPVKLPGRPGGEMGIMTSAGFTVPESGGNVVLIFDAGLMLAWPVVTDSGKVLLGPMLRPRRMRG